MDYDQNSGAWGIYWIRNLGWKNQIDAVGDGVFESYYGQMYPSYWVNNTSLNAMDLGFHINWGTFEATTGEDCTVLGPVANYFINNLSWNHGLKGGDDNVGEAFDAQVASDCSWILNMWNNNWGSVNTKIGNNDVMKLGATTYIASEINNGDHYTGGGGTVTGSGDISIDPLLVEISQPAYADNNFNYASPSSPGIDDGSFPYTTNGAGVATDILVITPLATGMDARFVFLSGDSIKIEDSGTYTIATVDSATQITLTTSESWDTGKGVWFTWYGSAVDIGSIESISGSISGAVTAESMSESRIVAGTTETLGAELITDGTFSDTANWTEGATWTVAGGVATCNADAAGSNVEQAITVEVGKIYEVTMTIDTLSAGLIKVGGGIFIGVESVNYDTPGTYRRYMRATATGNFPIWGNKDCVGTVSSVTVKEITVPSIAIQLHNDTWVAEIWDTITDATDTALIAGLDSGGAEAGGWDAVVKAGMIYSNVFQVSSTLVWIMIPPFSVFAIDDNEAVTVTIPAAALTTSTDPVVATPAFTVYAESSSETSPIVGVRYSPTGPRAMFSTGGQAIRLPNQ